MISPENGRAVLWSAMDKGQPSIFLPPEVNGIG
jgi:hypothetical protein